MGIGEALARARREAGLSIADLSARTRIRPSAIEGIERDDYSADGGGSGARDNIATLARALGADPAALVQAHDAARQPGEWIAAAPRPAPGTAAQAPEAGAPPEAFPPAPGPWPATADGDTQPIPVGQPQEPVTADGPPSPLTTYEPPPVTAGGPFDPITPAGSSGSAWPAFADRRRAAWIAAGSAWPAFTDRRRAAWIAAGAVLAVAGLGGILVVAGISGRAAPHSAVAGPDRGASRGATRPARTREPSPGHSASSPGPARSTPPPSHPPVRALAPASIAAFGPGGTSHGDSPRLARLALAGRPATPWHSAWYTTPRFGNLQDGTGLLLDMGRTVTITSARIALGGRLGADLTVRIGNSPALASLRPVAHAQRADGVVRLTTAPTRGRYVLVWFTKLPPDHAGTFQVSVYDVTLRGYP